MIGKWHLGTTPGYSPTYHGFDEWLGLPYSDDMGCVDKSWPNLPEEPVCRRGLVGDPGLRAAADAPHASKVKWPLPLYHSTSRNCSGQTAGNCNKDIVERPVQLESLASKYAAQASAVFVNAKASGKPFLLYVAFAHMHVPQFTGPAYTNSTGVGHFADALSEFDATVGAIIDSLEATTGREARTSRLHCRLRLITSRRWLHWQTRQSLPTGNTMALI